MRLIRPVSLSYCLDQTVDLNGVLASYAAMDSREVIKVMVRP